MRKLVLVLGLLSPMSSAADDMWMVESQMRYEMERLQDEIEMQRYLAQREMDDMRREREEMRKQREAMRRELESLRWDIEDGIR